MRRSQTAEWPQEVTASDQRSADLPVDGWEKQLCCSSELLVFARGTAGAAAGFTGSSAPVTHTLSYGSLAFLPFQAVFVFLPSEKLVLRLMNKQPLISVTLLLH